MGKKRGLSLLAVSFAHQPEMTKATPSLSSALDSWSTWNVATAEPAGGGADRWSGGGDGVVHCDGQ